ncbi:hypothetical protein [Roseisolibacter agri]|uniref:Lipocalin-like domain-containing protein n=1 Tax=Roseisolibacter agri TaxID=2014610 RepID=A0AA37V2H1_9BACT|nr:hypothetical protein [Roseisolibacter agri]GLC25257.1 hypothetical protein rosag_17700 [Roseisolibacter agri]
MRTLLLRTFRHALGAALLLAGTACGGDAPTGRDEGSIAGDYTLRTINGRSLPYTMLSAGVNQTEVLSSSLSLAADGTFREERSMRRTHAGVSITEAELKFGTYTSTGSGVTFRATTGVQVSGTRGGGGSVTFAEDGLTFVYGR